MKLAALHFQSVLPSATLPALALGGFLFFATAPAAKADGWDNCNRRVSYTEWRYHEAVEHFGSSSGEARHWARERHEAYERREHYRHEWHEHHRDPDNHYRGWDRR